jgi:hypothetical protein
VRRARQDGELRVWERFAVAYHVAAEEAEERLDMLGTDAVGASEDQQHTDVVEGLASLVEQSLLRQVENGGPTIARFSMLETIRAYGLERLAHVGVDAATNDAMDLPRIVPSANPERFPLRVGAV